MVDPTQRVRSGANKSGSPVLAEPFEHLIQHIKHPDPMLYEALKKISKHVTDISTNVEEIQATIIPQDKCTFGLVKTLVVGTNLTINYYIVRKAGLFTDFTAKISIQAPTGTAAILDVLKSTNDGSTWNTIFLPNQQIILPVGSTKTVIVKKFAIPGVSMGDLLRIDCLQIGSVNPGKGIEVVGRWPAKD